jgi:ElaB/YqjD/DUF883 family membrane-anchored ribosome-binding protein
MSKDPFQELVDELTALRRSIEHIARTSLDKDEAEALHQIVADAVSDMRQATKETPQALQSALKADRGQMAREASVAATRAAQEAVEGIRAELTSERDRLSQSASQARRAALRFSGGIWTALGATLATGAFLGFLTAYVVETGKTLLTVEQMVRYGCGQPWIGGQTVDQDDGSSFCAHWIVTPELAEYRRNRDGGS